MSNFFAKVHYQALVSGVARVSGGLVVTSGVRKHAGGLGACPPPRKISTSETLSLSPLIQHLALGRSTYIIAYFDIKSHSNEHQQ